MAATASFTRLAQADLADLVAATTDADPLAFQAYLAANGTSVADFDDDAAVFSVLLPVLSEDYDIDLEVSENEVVAEIAESVESLVFVLSVTDKEKYLARLNPDAFEADELREAFEDFTEDEDEDAGERMLAGIAALHQALAETDDDHVVVVVAA